MGKVALVEQPDAVDAKAFAAARDLCRRNDRGFYYATAFLPRAKRDAACAVVAFCGMVREAIEASDESLAGANGLRKYPVGATSAVDVPFTVQSPTVAMVGVPWVGACTTCGPTGSMDSRVALLRDRLEEIYEGRLELPRAESRSESQHALHAFALTVRRHQVPRRHFLDLAQALQRDQVVSRYATWPSLERHCHQGAGSVALALCAVFGVTHSGAGEFALKLATAMRLTTILRDLKADRARGTLYLPLEDLARFRYSERDLAGSVVNDNFRELISFEIVRARRLFHEGAEGLCWLGDDGSRLTVSTLVATSAGVLDAIERNGYDVYNRRPVLTAGQKFRRLPLAWRLSRRGPGERLPDLFRTARVPTR